MVIQDDGKMVPENDIESALIVKAIDGTMRRHGHVHPLDGVQWQLCSRQYGGGAHALEQGVRTVDLLIVTDVDYSGPSIWADAVDSEGAIVRDETSRVFPFHACCVWDGEVVRVESSAPVSTDLFRFDARPSDTAFVVRYAGSS